MQYHGVQLQADEQEFKVVSEAGQNFCLSGWVYSPDVGIQINRKPRRNVLDVAEPRRGINVFTGGGDLRITGRQPPNTKINVWGGGSITLDADAKVSVGSVPRKQDLRLAMSMGWAEKLDLEDLEILIGAGAQAHGLSVG